MNPANNTVVVTTAPVPGPLVGPENTMVDCPFCQSTVRTAVQYTDNAGTYIAAALCARLCCCCIPYCSNDAKNADHYCPECQRYLGTYRRF